jgi:outer membrane protein OmpA-like peptidoglycan-associated protein
VRYDEPNGFGATSLGSGGTLTVEFTDNALVDINGPDLYIFETFEIMEPVFVEISGDGYRWIDLGLLQGWNEGIDIHDFVEEGEVFHFVRITDQGLDARTPPGADIDAVAAIGSALRTTLHVSFLFDTNAFIPKRGAEFQLVELAESIREFEKANITITGHTDSVGDEVYNLELSQKRVSNIVVKLQSLLVGGNYAWSESSLGEMLPIADNETAEGRALNRRVEVLVQPLK